MKYSKLYKYSYLTFTLALATTAATAAPPPILQAGSQDESALDKIWALPVLYKNDDNQILEEFDLTGRFQTDYFHVDSSKGDRDFLEIRRFRLGVDSWFAGRHLEAKVTVDTALRSYNAPGIFYNRFTDFFLMAHVNGLLNIRAGKFEPHFGYDREFSDIQQKFFERGILDDQVFNNTGNDYVAGASASGTNGNWGYQTVVFSDNVGKEFGNFNGGASELFEASYDFSKVMGADKALLALDYMAMQINAKSDVFNSLHNAAATYFDYQKGRVGIVSQVGYGNGKTGKGDLYALTIMPGYYVIPHKLEAIVRYQYGTSDHANGIALMNRQDKTVGAFTGDSYDSVYMGMNYYIYGQKCKLMAGEQFDDLTGGTGAHGNFRGWTTLAGLRVYW